MLPFERKQFKTFALVLGFTRSQTALKLSGIPSGNRSFGYRQRKITSPGGVNRGRAINMLEVINLTNPEEAKNLTKRFFEDELKMDLADPRFNSRKRRESSVSVCYGIEDEVLYMH